MSELDSKGLKNLSKLCRIECSDDEEKALLENLKKILDYVEQLSEINTDGITPCRNTLESDHESFREDIEGPCLEPSAFLSNAQEIQDGHVKVPSVIPS